ncbi:uncharacterized protein LOC143275895 isoform X2 [Babylonia areolata]
MADQLTHRTTIMVGGALTSLALLFASFSQDLTTLLLTFGIVSGLGAGLTYTPSVTVVSSSFHRHRTLANGLTLAAPGLGLVVGPYVIRWMIDSFGWRFAMAMFGGVMAQICVLGALFFPHDSANPKAALCCPSARRIKSEDDPALKTSETTTKLNADTIRPSDHSHRHRADQDSILSGSRTKLEVKSGSRRELQILIGSRSDLGVRLSGSKRELTELEVTSGSRTELQILIGSRSDLVVRSPESKRKLTGSRMGLEDDWGSRSRPVSRTGLPVSEFGSVVLNQSVENLRRREVVEPVAPLSFTRRVRGLLCQRFVWLMCLNQVFMMCGHAINIVLYPAFVKSVGIPSHFVPNLYTAYGLTIIVARVAGGFLFSAIPRYLVHVFFSLQVAQALVFALLPVYGVSLPALFVGIVMVGLTYGPSFLLLSPIIIRYVGLADLSIAFGLAMLFTGASFLGAPTIAGITYDIFQSYSVSYYIAGKYTTNSSTRTRACGCSTVAVGTLPVLILMFLKDLQPPGVKDERKVTLLSATNQNTSHDLSAKGEAAAEEDAATANGNSRDISSLDAFRATDAENQTANGNSRDISSLDAFRATDAENQTANGNSRDISSLDAFRATDAENQTANGDSRDVSAARDGTHGPTNSNACNSTARHGEDQ